MRPATQLIRRALRENAFLVGIIALSSVAAGFAAPTAILFLRRAIASVEVSQSLHGAVASILAFVGLRGGGAILGSLAEHRLSKGLVATTAASLRSALYRAIVRSSTASRDSMSRGDMLSRLTECDTVASSVVLPIVGSLRIIVAAATALTLVGSVDLRLLLIAVVPVPLWRFATAAIGRRGERSSNTTAVSKSRFWAFTSEILSAHEDIDSWDRHDAAVKYQQRLASDYARNWSVSQFWQSARLSSDQVLVVASSLLCLVLYVWIGTPNTADMIAIYFYLAMAYEPIVRLGVYRSSTLMARASAERISDVMEWPVRESGDSPPTFSTELIYELDDVSFSYGANPVLANLSAEVKRGDFLVITGPSGSGKTTFMEILLTLRSPTSGSMRCAGVDVDVLDRESFLSKVGYLSQSPFLFRGSVRENLILRNPHVDPGTVNEVLEFVRIRDEIDALEDGMDTVVQEGGRGLSVGQGQRLALARELLSTPDILFLDEPTSALDAQNEELLLDSLSDIRGKITVIAISHREAVLGLASARIRL